MLNAKKWEIVVVLSSVCWTLFTYLLKTSVSCWNLSCSSNDLWTISGCFWHSLLPVLALCAFLVNNVWSPSASYKYYFVLGICSAYSIFNEDFRELPGTLNAERLDGDIRTGQLWAWFDDDNGMCISRTALKFFVLIQQMCTDFISKLMYSIVQRYAFMTKEVLFR